MLRKIVCLLRAFLFAAHFAKAGFCVSDPRLGDYRHEFQFFAGYSPQSSTLIGTATDRRFVLAGFSYGYTCWTPKTVSISYTAGVSPAAILLQPAQLVYSQGYPNGLVSHLLPSHAVYGVSFTPIGFTVDFARMHKIHPFFQTDGGVIASSEAIPADVPDATAVNFLFDLGGGAQWKFSEKRAFRFGYKFLHISNAGRTAVNPGIDNNIIYAGFSFLK